MKTSIKICDPAAEYFFAEGCFINELSNSVDDDQVSVARARVEPGQTTRWHYLRGTAERYVILSGRGRVEVAELPATPVTTGDVVVIAPEAKQRICNTGSDDLVFLAICTPPFNESVYVDTQG